MSQVAGVHENDDCVIISKNCRGSTVAARAVGVPVVPPRPAARDQGRWEWWPEIVV